MANKTTKKARQAAVAKDAPKPPQKRFKLAHKDTGESPYGGSGVSYQEAHRLATGLIHSNEYYLVEVPDLSGQTSVS